MSTRSLIGRRTEDGYEAVYCHNDGYPEHHAPILTRGFATDEAVTALFELGDLSVLATQIGRKHSFCDHGSDAESRQWCLAYGRDRGEINVAKRGYRSENAFLEDASNRCADYVYLFRDGCWFFRKMNGDHDWLTLGLC
ncbi:MAG: hypothetical protein V1809_01855 [Planctomycetota bacterium]